MGDNDDSKMGDDNTIVGNVPPRRMGSRNTIVGATNEGGNAIVNRAGTSIGANAGWDRTSVIIGSGAGANIGKNKKG